MSFMVHLIVTVSLLEDFLISFSLKRLLNLLLTTKKGNFIATRQSSETAKIVLHFSSLSHLLVFSLNDFPW